MLSLSGVYTFNEGAWSRRWKENLQKKLKYFDKPYLSATLSTINPTTGDENLKE
jgi:hypothetical protein